MTSEELKDFVGIIEGFHDYVRERNIKLPMLYKMTKDNEFVYYDVTPIVNRAYNWLVSVLSKNVEEDRPLININKLYNDFLVFFNFGTWEKPGPLVIEIGTKNNSSIFDFSADITEWFKIIFEDIAYFVNEQLFNIKDHFIVKLYKNMNKIHDI